MRDPDQPAAIADDLILPFQVEGVDVRGRIVRLGPAVDQVLTRHAYPPAVSRLLGEALSLAALLGSAIKLRGKLILQANGDGPVRFLVADYTAAGTVRGYAGFAADAIAETAGETELLGRGHLAITIDQGPDTERYQGVTPLEGGSLSAAVEGYFARSEQLRTTIRVSVAEALDRADDGATRHGWRAGGLLIQHLPPHGSHVVDASGDGGDPFGDSDEPEGWRRARMLTETVEPHELVDPGLAPERLLYRLYHEDGVRAFEAQQIAFACGCNAGRLEATLASYPPAEIVGMAEDDGLIRARCEFCSAQYELDPARLAAKAGA